MQRISDLAELGFSALRQRVDEQIGLIVRLVRAGRLDLLPEARQHLAAYQAHLHKAESSRFISRA